MVSLYKKRADVLLVANLHGGPGDPVVLLHRAGRRQAGALLHPHHAGAHVGGLLRFAGAWRRARAAALHGSIRAAPFLVRVGPEGGGLNPT